MSPSAPELPASDGLQTPLDGWRVLLVSGADRIRYLQSQLTSDVRSLAPGEGQPTALLDRSGRLVAWGFLQRRPEEVLLLAEPGASAAFAERLLACVIADRVEIVPLETGPLRLALGPLALAAAGELDPGRTLPVAGWGSRGVVTWDPSPLELDELDSEGLARLQALYGPPRWGIEASPGQLVNETTLLDSAVSSTKGCYLGQETVAKIASHRGASVAPMILEISGGFEGLAAGRAFTIAGSDRAGGVLRVLFVDGGRRLAHAGLRRELRLVGTSFEGVLEGGAAFQATVVAGAHRGPPALAELAQRLYHRGLELFAADREEEAAALLARVVELDPNAADAYESLGVIFGRHGRYDEAISLMHRLLDVDPTSVMAHTNLSLFHNRLGRIAEAEEEARLAAAAALERRRRESARAEEEGRARQVAAADRRRREDLYRQVLELDPEDPVANFGLGELAVEAGDHARAVGHLERTLVADPRFSAALLALGLAYEGLGELARARDTYVRGLEVALSRGDLQPANRMRERLTVLSETPTSTGSPREPG